MGAGVDIAPCPFCGGDGAIGEAEPGLVVFCKDCQTSTGFYQRQEYAINAWHARDTDRYTAADWYALDEAEGLIDDVETVKH